LHLISAISKNLFYAICQQMSAISNKIFQENCCSLIFKPASTMAARLSTPSTKRKLWLLQRWDVAGWLCKGSIEA